MAYEKLWPVKNAMAFKAFEKMPAAAAGFTQIGPGHKLAWVLSGC